HQVLLLVVYNACFVAPLVAIYATLRLTGDHAERYLGPARLFLQRHWPMVLAVVAVLAGGFTIWLGATGLVASHATGTTKKVAKKLHDLIPH
ncbi:MAG TPA: hypothetical protein VME01_11220, partial [Solirubrobacteraceae bacterium]|nr:hypothetical protein [Solirubrobacteraceae bacterium]